MRSTDIVFLDTECLGLDRIAPIWEFAAIRVTADGDEVARDEFQIRHIPSFWLDTMPPPFVADYKARYVEDTALWGWDAVKRVQAITEGRVEVAGSNAGFDLERLLILVQRHGFGEPNWHYHPLDVPSMVRGYLRRAGVPLTPPYRSDQVSEALGVNPADYARHTAMGDCEWCLAQWRLVEFGEAS